MAAQSSSAAAVKTSGAEISDELRRLQSGASSLDAYLDTQVARAVAHLEGQVSAGQMALIKDVLREQLVSSPALAELLRRAGVPLPMTDDTR